MFREQVAFRYSSSGAVAHAGAVAFLCPALCLFAFARRRHVVPRVPASSRSPASAYRVSITRRGPATVAPTATAQRLCSTCRVIAR